MTSWIVNYVIDKYLNHIMEVDSNVTDASIFNDGQIEFGNVKIKQEFLKTLNMPFFEFKETFIGKFTAKIYYSLMRMDLKIENHPIYIILDEVFILVKQKGMSDWSEEQKTKEMENFKNFKLQEWEDAYKQYLMNMAEATESDFVKKIIHNLNISISNIVIRFEDEISNPSNPYSLGLVISNLVSKPTNANFDINSPEDIPFGEINNKILILKGLSVFMDIKENGENDQNSFNTLISEKERTKNLAKKTYLKNSFEYYCYCNSELNELTKSNKAHNYLIYNLDLSLKLSLNQNIKKINKPVIYSNIDINSINLKINILQIKTIIKLLNVTKTYNIAQTGMESYYYSKKLSDKEKEEYMNIYTNYFEERHFKNSKEDIWSSLKNKSLPFEDRVAFNEIQAMRNGANIKLEYMKKINDYNDQIGKLKPGFFSYFTSQATIDEIKALEAKRDHMINSEDVIKKLMEEEMQKKNILDKDPFEGMDKCFIKNDIKLSLKKFSFELLEESSSELIDINFQDFETHLLQGIQSMQTYLYLGDFYINQYKLKDTVFNKIIESYNDNEQDIPIDSHEKGNVYEQEYESRKGAIAIGFELNPDLYPSNYRIRIRNSKRLYVYANLYSLKFIGYLIGEAVKSEINLAEVSKYATEEGYKHIQNGYKQVNNILAGEYQHFNMNADILIQGPRIIVPQNIIDKKNKKCLMLSFGEFGLLSKLAPKKDSLIDYKKIFDDKRLYDTYEMKIYGFELLTIDKFKGAAEINNTKKLPIIEKVDFDFIFSQIIEPKNEIRENFRIGMQYKMISLQIRDTQIEFLLYFLRYFNEMNEKLDEEIAKLSGADPNKIVHEPSSEKNIDELNKIADETHGEAFAEPNSSEDGIIIKNKKEEEKKKIESSILQKFFMKFQFNLLKVNITILKSLEPEEKDLLESNHCLSDDTEYKEYLSFILNNFSLDINMREDLYLELSMKIFNFFLIDKDFRWRLNNEGNISEFPILNQEFTIILGTLNNEIDRDLNHSRSMSMKSEAAEKTTEILKRLGKIPYFLDVILKQDTPKKKTDVNVTLTKFVLTFNFSTYIRAMKFLEKVLKYQEKILVPTKPLPKKNETIKEKLKIIESKKHEHVRKGKKKELIPKLLDIIKERKTNSSKAADESGNNLNNENSIHLKNSDKISVGEKSVYSRRQSIMHDNLDLYRKELVKQKLKFSFEMKQIELNIPLDGENERTKAIVFNFNTMLKLKQISESENYYDKATNKLVVQNYQKKNLFVNMMLFNIDFDMYNVANEQILFNLLNDKILSNSRITIFVKSFLLPEKKSEIMTVDVKLEPITMIMGFRQVRILKDLMEIMNNSMTATTDNKAKETDNYFSEKPNDPQIDDKIELKAKAQLSHEKLLNLSENSEEDTKSKKETSIYEEALSKKISKIDKKIENQIKYNTALFNQLMDVNVILEKATIKLIDNTGDYEKPLTMIELSKISLKQISNSNPYDIDNMCQAIVEMISERKPENLNICNLYTFMDAYFSIEMCSFNERVSDWEPILEPWSGNFRIEQIDKITRKKMEFRSDFLMNFNLSVQSVEVLNSILKKMNQNESNWKKEERKNSQQMIKSVDNTNDVKNAQLQNKADISLLFENRSGINLNFYFLADEAKKYNLINNYQKSFTKNDLSLIYQNLNDEIVFKKKDKFAFSFNDIPFLIDEIDFSYNHFIMKKIPIYNQKTKKNDESTMRSFNMDKNVVKETSGKENDLKEKLLKPETSNKKEKKDKKKEEIQSKNTIENKEEATEPECSKFIEVCIKIKNNGLVKGISIESNIGLFNNTCYHTKLCFFNTKSNNINQIFNNGALDFTKCAGVLKCNAHTGVQIPLNYILEPHLVFLAISLDNFNPNSENYNMIFSDFDYIYSVGDEYNRELSKGQLQDEELKNKSLKKIAGEKCLQVKFENESKITILSLDILLLKTKNHLITNLESDEEENLKFKKEMFYYQMILNPPVTVENKAPFDLNLNYKYFNKLSKDNANTNLNLESDKYNDNIFILPLDKHKIYNFDLNENLVNVSFSLNYQNQQKYFSKEIVSKDFLEEKNYINLRHQNNEKDKFEMIVELQKLATTKFFDYNYLNVESFFSKSRVFICYFDFILINRLEEKINIRPNNLKSSEEADKDLVCYNLEPKALNLFSTPRNNSRAKIKIENSEWSDVFEMAAHGLEAGHSMLMPDPINNANKINYEFATIITSSNNFNYSTILIIEPRHVIINKTGIDLKFRQVFGKDSHGKETQIILNDSEKNLKLFKYPNDKNSKNIQFFINKGFLDNEDQSNDLWSQTINVDNLQEFNIAIYLPKYFDFKSHSSLEPSNPNIYQYNDNCKYLLVRVVLQTMDNGLIYIILTQAKFPQFLIKNSTKEYLKIKQSGTNQILKIEPEKVVPYTLKDLALADSTKEIELEIFGKKSILNLDFIEATNEIILDKEKDIKKSNYYSNYSSKDLGVLNIENQEKENQRDDFINSLEQAKVFFSVSTDNKNVTRIININTNFDFEEGLMEAKQSIISKRIRSTVVNFKLKLKGIGLSIIDSFPKEVFYISFYNLKVILRNYVTRSGFVISKFANYVVYLKNFQVDYCLEGSFKQIIYPKVQYVPFKELEINKKDYVEFVKILITQANCTNLSNDSETEKLAQFEFILQELNVKIDQKVINVLLDLISQFVNRLDFYKEEAANAKEDKEEEDESDFYENGYFVKEIPEASNKIMHNYASNNSNFKSKSLLNVKSTTKITSQYISLKTTSALEKFTPEPTMAVVIPNYEEVLKKSDESGIYNIGNLFLSGIKINLTLRIDISSLEICLVPAFVTKLLGTVGNAIARITDSPLSFNELRISNVYNNMGYILACITGKYKSQGILQIYKIIGSSDLIGNPVGLVGKIGTGFIELFNEPRKGFVNGPIHFGTGVAKGVNSLVSNVVGGGLDVVGKITGTLYSATKNLQGEKAEMVEENEPSNVFSGAVDGVKGGVGEIAKGLAGIFLNPYKSAKREGVKGFFKGMGKGLIGAVISPFSAVLKVGNSLAIGMKNTATFFSKTKLKTDRFRHPRHINQSEALKPFDNDLAETQAIITNLFKCNSTGNGLGTTNTFPKIIYTKDFIYADKEYNEKTSTVIITDYYILVVFDATVKIMDVLLKNIAKTEVHKVKENEYMIVMFLRDGRRKVIPATDLNLLCQIHGVIQKLI